MVEIKTSKERSAKRKAMQQERDNQILSRFEQLRSEYNVSDAVKITANEFNLSEPTIYIIRKRNASI